MSAATLEGEIPARTLSTPAPVKGRDRPEARQAAQGSEGPCFPPSRWQPSDVSGRLLLR